MQDLSAFIKRVTFTLHSSFKNASRGASAGRRSSWTACWPFPFASHRMPSRFVVSGAPVVEAPPFQVTEEGWGEFDIFIKIAFKDSNYRPVGEMRGFPPAVSRGGVVVVQADGCRCRACRSS